MSPCPSRGRHHVGSASRANGSPTISVRVWPAHHPLRVTPVISMHSQRGTRVTAAAAPCRVYSSQRLHILLRCRLFRQPDGFERLVLSRVCIEARDLPVTDGPERSNPAPH